MNLPMAVTLKRKVFNLESHRDWKWWVGDMARCAAYSPSLSSSRLPCSWVMEVRGQEVKVQNWR